MLKYSDILKGLKGDEEKTRESLENLDEFLDEMREESPRSVRCFMERQYEAVNGRHLNEKVARKLVSEMWHTDASGNKVSGELVTPAEAMTLIEDKPAEKQAVCKWDAYAAANTAVHDGIRSGVPKSDILKVARYAWFHDEDMPDPGKVYWYFRDTMFG